MYCIKIKNKNYYICFFMCTLTQEISMQMAVHKIKCGQKVLELTYNRVRIEVSLNVNFVFIYIHFLVELHAFLIPLPLVLVESFSHTETYLQFCCNVLNILLIKLSIFLKEILCQDFLCLMT